jgi:hypothetical protein
MEVFGWPKNMISNVQRLGHFVHAAAVVQHEHANGLKEGR